MKKWIALLLALALLMMQLGAYAEGTDAFDALLNRWKDAGSNAIGWATSELAQKATVRQEDALRIAVDTLLRMEYVSMEMLPMYRPSLSISEYEWEGHWLVYFEPADLQSDLEPYWVELTPDTGLLIGVIMGENRYSPTTPEQARALSVYQAAARAPIDADTIEEFIQQWKLKHQSYGNHWQLPDPLAGTPFLAPGGSDISQDQALQIAIEALMEQEGFTIEDLTGYSPIFDLARDEAGRHVYTIKFFPVNLMVGKKYVKVMIDAETSEVVGVALMYPSEMPVGIVDEAAYEALVATWKARDERRFELPPADGISSIPRENEIRQEEALRLGVETLFKLQDWPMETLYAYTADFFFFETEEIGMDNMAPNQRAMCIYMDWNHVNTIPSFIRITIDAPSHQVTDIVFAHTQYAYPAMSANIAAVLQNDGITQLINEWKATHGESAFLPLTVPFDDSKPQLSGVQYNFTQPKANDISQDMALRIAIDAIMRLEDIDAESLSGYKPVFRFGVVNENRGYWSVYLEGSPGVPSLSKTYVVEVESPSGFVKKIHVEESK